MSIVILASASYANLVQITREARAYVTQILCARFAYALCSPILAYHRYHVTPPTTPLEVRSLTEWRNTQGKHGCLWLAHLHAIGARTSCKRCAHLPQEECAPKVVIFEPTSIAIGLPDGHKIHGNSTAGLNGLRRSEVVTGIILPSFPRCYVNRGKVTSFITKQVPHFEGFRLWIKY
jgi:hypothetical protein